MIVFIGITRGTFRSHKTSVADLQDLRLTQNFESGIRGLCWLLVIELGPRS